MARNKIFLSYPSDDGVIADKIFDAAKTMPSNGLDVFLDRAYIRGGTRIPDVIRRALTETVYFVAVGTNVLRRNFDWCGEELGFYQASHPDEERRETCLYDKTMPELFMERKSFKAQSLTSEHTDELGFPVIEARRSEIYNFLIELAELNATLYPAQKPDQYWRDVPPWAEKYTNEITNSFFLALQSRVRDEWYPQGRMDIAISRGEFYRDDIPTIPIDAQVAMAGSAYNLFKSAAPAVVRPFSWDAFTRYVREKTGSDLLIRMITDVVISALPDREEAKSDYVFQAPNGKYYRIILVKHSVYGNKRRDVVINLVETLQKVKAGDEDTTTLIAGIVLGSKYRSLFVEDGAKYGDQKLKGLVGEKEALVDALTHMLRDIDRISADSASDGLADYGELQTLLGNTVQVKTMFESWFQVFPPMEAAAKKFITDPSKLNEDAFFAAYASFLDITRRNNTTFLRLCLDEYRKRLI